MSRAALLVAVLIGALACGAGATAPTGGAPPDAAARAGGAPASSAPPALVPMRFGLNTVTANVTPVWVAKDEGYFAQQGIDAELVAVPGAERIVSALLSGELPMSLLALPAAVNANVSGADFTYYASYAVSLQFWLYARPEFTAVRDLRGEKFAVTGRGGVVQRSTALILERNGLDPERDATLLQLGTLTESATALLAGAVGAALLSPPTTFQVEDQGMRFLVSTMDYGLPGVTGIVASRGWVARNEDLARRVVQAVSGGLAFAHLQPERTRAIMAKYIQSDDTVLVSRTYAAMEPGWQRIPYTPADTVRAELDAMASETPAARDIRLDQFVDNHFVEQLERAGYYAELYR